MPEKIGQYTVVSQIGRGGMGVVYKARDESLNRFVAIKVLNEQLTEDSTFLQRFVREAQAAAGLSHPNIVQIFFIGEDNSHPYFVMEFVSGRSLDQLLRAEGRIDNPRASQLILQAAHGLAAAHDQGIIHRDIKPANLILDDRGLLKIADFGLALPVDSHTQLTATGMFVGTPGYLAPEQVAGEKADHRTDIYALGVTFYLLLTGTPPFRGDSPLALVRQIMDPEPTDVSSLNPNVDAATGRILGRMIAKDRAARYQNCHELVADLEDYLATQGVRSMTAGLATRTPSTSPELAASMAAPTQAINSRANSKSDAQSAATMIQSKAESPTLPNAPLVSPNTQPDAAAGAFPLSAPVVVPPVVAAQPPRSMSRALVVVLVVAVVLLVGGGIGAAVFGTKIFRGLQKRSEPKSLDTVSSEPDRKTATPAPTATPPEGVLLLQTTKPPMPALDSKGAGGSVTVKGSSHAGPPVTPARVRADLTSPASGQGAAVEKHQTAAENSHRARAGVAIAATGDPALSGAVSSVLRSQLEAAGIEVVDAQTLPATEDLLRGGDASAGRLIDRLSSEGYAVLLLARIDPTGQRALTYSGRHDTAYSSRVTLTTYDLATGKPFGSSGTATIEYTSINAESASEEIVGPLARSIAKAIRSH
jgi:eukaryotic-like serine/threonine-protein kinase